jgi:hypothetical protein
MYAVPTGHCGRGGMLLGPVMLLVVVPPLRMLFLNDDDDLSKDVASPQIGAHP